MKGSAILISIKVFFLFQASLYVCRSVLEFQYVLLRVRGNWRATSAFTHHRNSAEGLCISGIRIVCVRFVATLSPACPATMLYYISVFSKRRLPKGPLEVVSFKILPLTAEKGRLCCPYSPVLSSFSLPLPFLSLLFL